jgi:hypothetical protein
MPNVCGTPQMQSLPLGWFKIVAPFTWHQSDGQMPIEVGAMIDDGTPQDMFVGVVDLGVYVGGRLITLYDENHVQLPTFRTTNFNAGGWHGYGDLVTATGATEDMMLQAVDPVSQVAGDSTPIHWVVP